MPKNLLYLRTEVDKGLLRDDLTGSLVEYINEGLQEIQNRHNFVAMKTTFCVSVGPAVESAGGNVVPIGAVWPVGSGTLSFVVSGLAVGAHYYANLGDASSLSVDGTTPTITESKFFVATQSSYTLLADASRSGKGIVAAVIAAGLWQTAKFPPTFKELQKWRPVHYITDDGQFIPTDVVFEAQQDFRVWAFGGTPMQTWPPRAYMERQAEGTVLGILEPLTCHFNFRVFAYQYLPDLVNDADISPLAFKYPSMVIAKAKAIAFSRINDPASAAFENEFEGKLAAAIRQDSFSEVVGRETRM